MPLDDLFAEYLQAFHTGERNAISSRELETIFRIRGPDLRRCVNRLRCESIPICSFDYGYYYAETEEELSRTIRQLRSRRTKIARAEYGLCRAQIGFTDTGQLRLPMEGDDP